MDDYPNRPRSPGRMLMFGLSCLLLGWVSAGSLEFFKVAIWKDAVVVLVLSLVVAAAADRV